MGQGRGLGPPLPRRLRALFLTARGYLEVATEEGGEEALGASGGVAGGNLGGSAAYKATGGDVARVEGTGGVTAEMGGG